MEAPFRPRYSSRPGAADVYTNYFAKRLAEQARANRASDLSPAHYDRALLIPRPHRYAGRPCTDSDSGILARATRSRASRVVLSRPSSLPVQYRPRPPLDPPLNLGPSSAGVKRTFPSAFPDSDTDTTDAQRFRTQRPTAFSTCATYLHDIFIKPALYLVRGRKPPPEPGAPRSCALAGPKRLCIMPGAWPERSDSPKPASPHARWLESRRKITRPTFDKSPVTTQFIRDAQKASHIRQSPVQVIGGFPSNVDTPTPLAPSRKAQETLDVRQSPVQVVGAFPSDIGTPTLPVPSQKAQTSTEAVTNGATAKEGTLVTNQTGLQANAVHLANMAQHTYQTAIARVTSQATAAQTTSHAAISALAAKFTAKFAAQTNRIRRISGHTPAESAVDASPAVAEDVLPPRPFDWMSRRRANGTAGLPMPTFDPAVRARHLATQRLMKLGRPSGGVRKRQRFLLPSMTLPPPSPSRPSNRRFRFWEGKKEAALKEARAITIYESLVRDRDWQFMATAEACGPYSPNQSRRMPIDRDHANVRVLEPGPDTHELPRPPGIGPHTDNMLKDDHAIPEDDSSRRLADVEDSILWEGPLELSEEEFIRQYPWVSFLVKSHDAGNNSAAPPGTSKGGGSNRAFAQANPSGQGEVDVGKLADELKEFLKVSPKKLEKDAREEQERQDRAAAAVRERQHLAAAAKRAEEIAERRAREEEEARVELMALEEEEARRLERKTQEAQAEAERKKKEAEEKARAEAEAAELQKHPILKPVTAEWRDKIAEKLDGVRDPLASIEGTRLSMRDFKTLLPAYDGNGSGWLNDEIVNEYLGGIAKCVQQKAGWAGAKSGAPPVHAFGTHFFSTLEKRGHAGVARWTKRPGLSGRALLDCEQVLVPVNNGSHWTLLVVSGTRRTIAYYDSLGGRGGGYVERIRLWLREELQAAYKGEEWRVLAVTPHRQENSSDCGVFVCLNGHAVLAGKKPEHAYRGEDVVGLGREHVAAVLLGMAPAI